MAIKSKMKVKAKPAKKAKEIEYDDTNKGVMFDNAENKAENEKRPDFRGHVNVDGTEYWISGWLKDTKVGTVLSLALQQKDE